MLFYKIRDVGGWSFIDYGIRRDGDGAGTGEADGTRGGRGRRWAQLTEWSWTHNYWCSIDSIIWFNMIRSTRSRRRTFSVSFSAIFFVPVALIVGIRPFGVVISGRQRCWAFSFFKNVSMPPYSSSLSSINLADLYSSSFFFVEVRFPIIQLRHRRLTAIVVRRFFFLA